MPKPNDYVVGIDIVGLGYVLLSVRVFDALTDPAIGYISDRTHTRYGRRRPYIALGAVCVALTIIFLFNPPEASPAFEMVWFTMFIYALFLFWTGWIFDCRNARCSEFSGFDPMALQSLERCKRRKGKIFLDIGFVCSIDCCDLLVVCSDH